MIDAHSIPDAVQWHEGMLLSPHHFQQADRRTHELQAYLTLASAPFCWGIRQKRLDAGLLVDGRFAVIELEALLPDGLLVTYPRDSHAPALELDLRPVAAERGPSDLAVHLTVPARSPQAATASAPQRFRSVEGSEVHDENTGDNPIPIPRLLPALSLHWTESPLSPPPNRYVSLPLALLRFDGQTFGLLDYEPPRLRVEPDTRLAEIAMEMVATLRRKAVAWGDMAQSAALRGQASMAGDSMVTLRALVRSLPRLEALLHVRVAHPFEVYLAMTDVAGDLAIGPGRVALPSFAPYRHADPLSAFSEVAAFVRDALEALRSPYRSVPFARPAPGRFELRTIPADSGESLVIGARLAVGGLAAGVSAWIEAALIGSARFDATMRLNRVRGATRVQIGEAPELDLVPPPNMLLFRLSRDPVFIVSGEPLQIAGPVGADAGEPAELALFLPATSAVGGS